MNEPVEEKKPFDAFQYDVDESVSYDGKQYVITHALYYCGVEIYELREVNDANTSGRRTSVSVNDLNQFNHRAKLDTPRFYVQVTDPSDGTISYVRAVHFANFRYGNTRMKFCYDFDGALRFAHKSVAKMVASFCGKVLSPKVMDIKDHK